MSNGDGVSGIFSVPVGKSEAALLISMNGKAASLETVILYHFIFKQIY